MKLVRASWMALVWCGLLLSLLSATGSTLAKETKAGGRATADELRVEPLMLLGPLPYPLPAFAEETQPDGKAVTRLLEAQLLPDVFDEPSPGERVAWFTGGAAEWRVAEIDRGLVSLDTPGTAKTSGPAVAWLATYLSTERFVEVELRVLGDHPRRAWLDGAPVASGGTATDGSPVKAELSLTPGKHCLLLKTVLDRSRDKPWSLAATLTGSRDTRPEVEASLDVDRPLRLRDVLDPPNIGSLSVSPDGSRVAIGVSRILDGTDDAESWIEIRNTTDGTLLDSWRGGTTATQVAWSPDGRYISYVASAGDSGEDTKASTLFLYDLTERRVSPLLEKIAHLDGYTWSPDGRSVAYSVTVEAPENKTGIKRFRGLMDRWADYRNKQQLYLVAVPDGARRQIVAGELSASLVDFAPDGSALLFTRVVEDLDRRPYSRTELWRLELEDFSSRKLRDFGWFGDARFSPDGGRLLVKAGAGEFGGVGVNLKDSEVPNSYDNQLFIWDPRTDSVQAITKEFAPAVRDVRWSGADGNVYLTAEDADYVRLYRYDTRAGTFGALDPGPDVIKSFDLATDAALAVGLGSGVWRPQELFAVDLSSGAARRLQHPAGDWFSRIRTGEVSEWDFTSSDGRRIDGRVYFPPGFDARRKYPCIVYYYGGTVPIGRDFGGRYPKEWWASNGYVVYVPEPSGATGFGQEFSATHVNDWGRTSSREIIEGTRKFLEAHPFVDPARVGCIGASYGGFMTMLLTTETDIYAAAVSHAGISSLASYWGEGYWGYSYSAVATADSFPWNRRDLYVDQSPLFRADKVDVPILLTHGSADTNVPRGESDAFYIALKLLGKPVEYLQIEGENHWIVDHDKRLAWSRSIVAWFDRWLKGQPEWWDHLYPDDEPEVDEGK